MLDVNLRATQVLRSRRPRRLRRVVFVSSAGVFRSGESATPLAEDAPVTMEHPYAILKVAAERLVAFARGGAERRRHGGAPRLRLRAVRAAHRQPHRDVQRLRGGWRWRGGGSRSWPRGRRSGATGSTRATWRAASSCCSTTTDRSPLYHLGTGRNYSMRETIEMIATLVPGTRVRWTDDAREANVVVANNRRVRVGVRPGAGRFRIRAAVCVAGRSAHYLAFLQAMEHEAAKGRDDHGQQRREWKIRRHPDQPGQFHRRKRGTAPRHAQGRFGINVLLIGTISWLGLKVGRRISWQIDGWPDHGVQSPSPLKGLLHRRSPRVLPQHLHQQLPGAGRGDGGGSTSWSW